MKLKCVFALLFVFAVMCFSVPDARDTAIFDALTKPACAFAADDESEEADDEEDEKKDKRFRYAFSDEAFNYYVDCKTMRFVNKPNSRDYIIDAWIRMVPVEEDEAANQSNAAAGGYTYPQKYFLEHYLVDQNTERIQFLAELEVVGRPDNNVDQRSYSNDRWERLIPGSLEEAIYFAVIKYKKFIKRPKDKRVSTSRRDFIEEVFRISL